MTRRLGAVLLNPPLTGGHRTSGALARAASILGCDEVRLANLAAVATRNSGELATAATGLDWSRARTQLTQVLPASDVLLFGWGVLDHLGGARPAATDQVRWLLLQAQEAGHRTAWAVGAARHPSRWHQYTADRHGRTNGGTAADRLAAVLVERPLRPAEGWTST